MIPLKLLAFCKDHTIEIELKQGCAASDKVIRGTFVNLDRAMNIILLDENTNREVFVKGNAVKAVVLPNYIINTIK